MRDPDNAKAIDCINKNKAGKTYRLRDFRLGYVVRENKSLCVNAFV